MQLKTFTLAAMTALCAFTASAQGFTKAEDAIKYRQSAFSVMEQHFATLGAMAAGKAPFDAKLAAENADILAVLGTLPWAGFGPGTEGGKSKPAIWTEKAKFDTKQKEFGEAAGKLVEAAKSGDLDRLKASFGPAFESCKSCHKEFKNK